MSKFAEAFIAANGASIVSWNCWGINPGHDMQLTAAAEAALRAYSLQLGESGGRLYVSGLVYGRVPGMYCTRCGMTAGEICEVRDMKLGGMLVCSERPRVVAARA